MSVFMLGAIAMGSLSAALFFLRFWTQTKDRLFLMFAIAFGLEALNRTALALSPDPSEGAPLLYVVRLLAYALILAAIVDKNVRPAP
ncbi:MAG: hypothetical protein HY329_03685 [Chloroflexi bacterium]|nr:hypothetical protein [Chloroflexota bacterium]